MKLRLTPRLRAVAALVPEGAKVADIGSDHAYVPVDLIRSGRAQLVIASDVHQGPVENARKVVAMAALEDRIEVRLGSGFEVYGPEEVDTAVLAGMGGFLIRDLILEAFPLVKTLKCLVLQPMVAIRELRVWLLENGFEIIEERVAQEGQKFYEIFSVRYTGISMLQVDFKTAEMGVDMFRSEDEIAMKYLAHRIRKTEGVLRALSQAKNSEKTEIGAFEARLKLLKEVETCLSTQKK
ncbi:tRNA (adenine(22)-N(1))-methyltransferase [Acidaminobacter hydrogenoformans]|uniref:tRNA (Adenine22-N1)-methyltransferase n=1 Tax=Acidaminobacter hydrogenoformans DSM 2784 TaxID=1120920 RepID=A0A1G5RSS8_9FIRM|nr:class I SAM-dependent methyltransferase [Acidaminobacter hydrogenoformans]SCZ77142.1 tRNA (adenine22-N1)-methyltransferase [Acidaminobacter hydrogenoformans DSM 2784]